MELQVADIRSLLRRAYLSAHRGYQVALGSEYAQALGGSDGSPAGLIALCKKALADTAEPIAVEEPADEAPATDDAPPTLRPPAPVSVAPVELAVPVEAPPEPPVEAAAEEAVEAPAEETDEEGEPEDAVEPEASEVAKDPAATTSKSRRRRRK